MLLVKVGHFHLNGLLVSTFGQICSQRFVFKVYNSCLNCGVLEPQGVSHVMQPLFLNQLRQRAQWTDLRENSQIREISFFFYKHIFRMIIVLPVRLKKQ